MSCTRLRAEAVDGVAASVFEVDEQDDLDVADQAVWIADDGGLMLRAQFAMDVGDGGERESPPISYGDVTAPAGAE